MSILFSLAILAWQGAQGPVLSLDDAVAIAMNNAFSVQTANSRFEQTRQQVNEAKASLGPKVSLGGTYTRFDRSVTAVLAPGADPVTEVPIDQKQSSATLTWPIDISGNISRGVRAARATLAASKENINTVKNDLKRDVRHSYFQVAQAKEQVQVNQSALKDQQDRLKNTQQQFDAGVLAKVDVLRQQVQVSQAQSNLIAAQNALELAHEAFNNTLGRAVETPFDVQPSDNLPVISSDNQTLVAAAQANRPEIKALIQTGAALAEVTKAEERSLQPSLNLSVTASHNYNPGATSQASSTVGVVALTLPIFDSGVTRARVKQDRQVQEQNRIQRAQVSLGISLEVRQARTNLDNAKSRLDVATAQVASAEETYRLAVVRLNAGQGILLEVIDAEADLTRARTGLVSARYDYLTAYSDLQRAVGSDDPQAATQQATGAKN